MKDLEPKVIARVDEDFSPYYQKYGSPPLALTETPTQTDKTTSKSKRYKWWDMSKYPK